MDITVVGLLVISIPVLLLFLFLHLNNLRKENAAKAVTVKIRKLTAQKKISIGRKAIINGQFIGLDRSNKLLILSYGNKENVEVDAIPLIKIAYCKLDRQTTEDIHRGRNRIVSEFLLNRISLLFFSTKKKLLAEFVFFDEEKNKLRELPDLTKKAEYWKKVIKKTGIIEVT